MSKRLSLSAAVAVAALMAMPAASQAHDCLGFHRAGHRAVAAVDHTRRVVRRTGDRLVHCGDRLFGWLFHCNHHRRHRL